VRVLVGRRRRLWWVRSIRLWGGDGDADTDGAWCRRGVLYCFKVSTGSTGGPQCRRFGVPVRAGVDGAPAMC